MITRRQLLKAGAAAGTAAAAGPVVSGGGTALALPITAAVLDAATIPKYVSPLFAVPAAKPSRVTHDRDEYVLAVRQFKQQMLPDRYPRTTVFGFGSAFDSRSFSTPGPTIETWADRWARVTWSNQLVNRFGNYLPHLLPVDPTLHWANPPGGVDGRDITPEFSSTPDAYTGPVPLVVHLHGQHAWEESDGYPEAWYLPPAWNIPHHYAKVGSTYDQFRQQAQDRHGVHWSPGNAVFQYPNDQRATALWYHSHTLGMTRTNIYAGQAGMYMIRGGPSDVPPGVLPGPAPGPFDAAGQQYYELPLVIQDKTFNDDGSLFFPESRADFGDTEGPFIPETDVHPIWSPVFFGDTIVVNGRTWPYLEVEPRRYRFRVLNASNVRGYNLKMVTDPLGERPAPGDNSKWGSESTTICSNLPLSPPPFDVQARSYKKFKEISETSTIIICCSTESDLPQRERIRAHRLIRVRRDGLPRLGTVVRCSCLDSRVARLWRRADDSGHACASVRVGFDDVDPADAWYRADRGAAG